VICRSDILTCEAVVAEACFLLARGGFDPSMAIFGRIDPSLLP
jgi:hypothetical protein